jgi:DNA-directed RNA polymerase specialized sigma24 family protein
VEGLREEDREVISLRYFLELSEAEAASVMGCAHRHRKVPALQGRWQA